MTNSLDDDAVLLLARDLRPLTDVETRMLHKLGITRPSVIAMARCLDFILSRNDYKGGWTDLPFSTLVDNTVAESNELEVQYSLDIATRSTGKVVHPSKLLCEALDVCATSMMVVDSVLNTQRDSRWPYDAA